MTWEVRRGDCIEAMRAMPEASIDAIVCDPPYGLGFMGREWDSLPPGLPWAQECLRVLKPGGHLLAFGGTRTYHRLTCAVEDAGFEIRDCLAWLYGSGFPKSLDVSKAIDRRRDDMPDIECVRAWLNEQRLAAGVTLGQINVAMGLASNGGGLASTWTTNQTTRGVPKWDQWLALRELCRLPDDMDAEVWRLNGRKGTPGEAWGERPAAEYDGRPGMAESWTDGAGWTGSSARGGTGVTAEAKQWQGWGTALKPAFEPVVMARKPLSGTVAANVLEHGTGALNVDGCRIGTDWTTDPTRRGWQGRKAPDRGMFSDGENVRAEHSQPNDAGRWPANVLLDPEAAAMLDEQTGEMRDGVAVQRNRDGEVHNAVYGAYAKPPTPDVGYGGEGGASRFFYVAKASSAERSAGLDDDRNVHPTVKPIDLMRWLVRLVTPPNGTVLDPFTGSGTTGIAAVLEGFDFIGVEREAEYADIADARIQWWAKYDVGTDTDAALDAGKVRDAVVETGQLDMLG